MEKERSRLPVTRVREYSSSSSSSPLNRTPRLYVPPQRRDGKREPRREGKATLSLNSSAVLIGSTDRTTRYLSFFSFLFPCLLSFFLSLFQSTVKGSAIARFLLNVFTFGARVALKQGERKSLTPRYARKNMLPRKNRYRGRRIRLPNRS